MLKAKNGLIRTKLEALETKLSRDQRKNDSPTIEKSQKKLHLI